MKAAKQVMHQHKKAGKGEFTAESWKTVDAKLNLDLVALGLPPRPAGAAYKRYKSIYKRAQKYEETGERAAGAGHLTRAAPSAAWVPCVTLLRCDPSPPSAAGNPANVPFKYVTAQELHDDIKDLESAYAMGGPASPVQYGHNAAALAAAGGGGAHRGSSPASGRSSAAGHASAASGAGGGGRRSATSAGPAGGRASATSTGRESSSSIGGGGGASQPKPTAAQQKQIDTKARLNAAERDARQAKQTMQFLMAMESKPDNKTVKTAVSQVSDAEKAVTSARKAYEEASSAVTGKGKKKDKKPAGKHSNTYEQRGAGRSIDFNRMVLDMSRRMGNRDKVNARIALMDEYKLAKDLGDAQWLARVQAKLAADSPEASVASDSDDEGGGGGGGGGAASSRMSGKKRKRAEAAAGDDDDEEQDDDDSFTGGDKGKGRGRASHKGAHRAQRK
jgi:hypothetical protein